MTNTQAENLAPLCIHLTVLEVVEHFLGEMFSCSSARSSTRFHRACILPMTLIYLAAVGAGCSSGGNSPLASTQEDADALLAELGYEEPRIQWANPVELDIPITPMTILYGDSLFYRSNEESFRSRRGYMIRPLQGAAFLENNQFFRIQNSTGQLNYISRNPSIALVTEQGEVLFGAAGQTSIVVGFRDIYVDIPIRVVTVGLPRSLVTSEVSALWGPAEDLAGVILNWGQFALLNEKDYRNTIPGTALQIEHWFYSRLPGGYLEFRGNPGRVLRLWQIRTLGWENTLFSPIYPLFYDND